MKFLLFSIVISILQFIFFFRSWLNQRFSALASPLSRNILVNFKPLYREPTNKNSKTIDKEDKFVY
jgi:hypothetical protein